MDWGDASENKTNSKLAIVGAPMFISTMPPGCTADDNEQWAQTYGASQDAVLSLLDGSALFSNIQASITNIQAPYSTVLPIANNVNLYDKPDGQQQIQFVVSKDNPETFRSSDSFGTVGEARSIGMRAPMMMVGWGRTVGLRPTDPDPADGRINDESHKLDRSTWKTAPLDVRWDNERRMWRGWNDLIADQEDKKLGTLVFSTNPHPVCGFPYLRGLLEDVWWVRRTDAAKPQVPTDDTTSTGEVCTTLRHKLFDPVGLGAGALHDVFICHLGQDVACGSEVTKIGNTADTPPDDDDSSAIPQGSLEIRCSSIFHWSNDIGTAILFDPDFTAAFAGGDNLVGGVMGLVEGRWGPIVDVDQIWNNPAFDLCGKLQYRFHMSTLTKNSEAVAEDGVFTLENFICQWNEEYTACILRNISWVAHNAGSALWAINFLLPAYVKAALISLATNTQATITAAVGALAAATKAALNSLIAQIQLCFAQLEIVCPLEFDIPPVPVPPIGVEIDDIIVPGKPPPNCRLESFAAWEFKTGSQLSIDIVNPCLSGTNFTSSCGAPGAPDGVTVDLFEGISTGGTDDEGDVSYPDPCDTRRDTSTDGGPQTTDFGDPSAPDGDPNDGTPPGED